MSKQENTSPTTSFKNHFLVALNSLEGDYFHRSLSILIDHTPEGAFGLVVNRPTPHTLGEVFPQLATHASLRVMEGGPVEQDKMFFLHAATHSFDSTLALNESVSLTTSKDFILALEEERAPTPLLAIVGYAGWGSGQLERELGENTWLLTPCEPQIIFDVPIEQRAAAAAQLLGVDLNLISTRAGHD